ncbi:MAG TPA: tyrosine-type recombinase/integrase [Anaerolineaceae bacterium]|nr:tyrosine-type recombinase/integrase [Anaerolineaceae bacterium]
MGDLSIKNTIDLYLELLQTSRSLHTALTYQHALNFFLNVLQIHHTDPEHTPPTSLNEEMIGYLAAALKDLSPATEQLYLTAVAGFYEFLVAENLANINLTRMRKIIQHRSRRPGVRLPQFPIQAIDKMINYMINIINIPLDNVLETLRLHRDRAFLLVLADTGMRVHEACNLRRGDIDWDEGRAIIIGKGDRQAVIRFSQRSLLALRGYLNHRATLDGASGRPLRSLPVFARHDKGAGKKVKPITTTTGRNIVSFWVEKILGPEEVGNITPHSFRHYFVTRVLQKSGNLKLAQELARHRSISVTQRYAHLSDSELDQGYHDVFEGSNRLSDPD